MYGIPFGTCKLADDDYGLCQGPVLRVNDNDHRNPTVYCEYHARMVMAWIKLSKQTGPIHQFVSKLDTAGLETFRATMETVSLDSFVPYVLESQPQTYRQSELDICTACEGVGWIDGVRCHVCNESEEE